MCLCLGKHHIKTPGTIHNIYFITFTQPIRHIQDDMCTKIVYFIHIYTYIHTYYNKYEIIVGRNQYGCYSILLILSQNQCDY